MRYRCAFMLLASLTFIIHTGCQSNVEADPIEFPTTVRYDADGNIIPAGSGTWTVLVYSVSDNNLDTFLPKMLEEMMSVGSTVKVKIVVQADRSDFADEGHGDEVPGLSGWTTAKRLLIEHGEIEELADLGEVNMGSQFAFSDFIEWGITNYPAEHYILAVLDHGGGWQGIGWDNSSGNNDNLTPGELGEALESSVSNLSMGKLDLIVFKACYMASAEIIETVYQYASFMVGHPGISLSPYSYWENLLTHLNATPSPSGLTAAQVIATSYMNDHLTKEYDTVSVIDLSYAEKLRELISDLSYQLIGDLETMSEQILQVYQNTEIQLSPDAASYKPRDIFNFIAGLQNLSSDYRLLYERAEALQNEMILFNWASDGLTGSKGLTIYFPRYYSSKAQYDYIYGMDDWRQFLWEFSNCQIASQAEDPLFTDSSPDVDYEDDGSITLTGYFANPEPEFELHYGDFEFGYFDHNADANIILGNVTLSTPGGLNESDYLTMDFEPEFATLNWSAKSLRLVQGDQTLPVSFKLRQQDNSHVFCYSIKFQYYADGDRNFEPETIYRDIYVDIRSGEVVDDFYWQRNNWYAEFAPEPGSLLRPLLNIRNDNGIGEIPAGEIYFYADQPIEIERIDIPSPRFIKFEVYSNSGYGYLYMDSY